MTKKPTITKWNSFIEASVVPVAILCDGYHPTHAYNSGCHTNLPIKAENMIDHLDKEHGGGFIMVMKRTDGKPWDGWQKLADEGIELIDFRDDVSGQIVPIHPQHILRQFTPHKGKNNRVKAGGTFLLTISRNQPLNDDN